MSLRTCYDDLNNVQQAFGVEYARHSQVFIIVPLTPSPNGSGLSLLQVSLRRRPDCPDTVTLQRLPCLRAQRFSRLLKRLPDSKVTGQAQTNYRL
jgi:hypothetical protein